MVRTDNLNIARYTPLTPPDAVKAEMPLTQKAATATQGWVNSMLTVIMMICAVGVLIEASRRWYRVLVKGEHLQGGAVVSEGKGKPSPPHGGCC